MDLLRFFVEVRSVEDCWDVDDGVLDSCRFIAATTLLFDFDLLYRRFAMIRCNLQVDEFLIWTIPIYRNWTKFGHDLNHSCEFAIGRVLDQTILMKIRPSPTIRK